MFLDSGDEYKGVYLLRRTHRYLSYIENR